MSSNNLNKRKLSTGKRITEIRKNMNMSKEQFAKLIGISGQYLGMLERGLHYPSTEKIIELCERTGTSSDFILFGLGQKNLINDELKNLLLECNCNDLEKAFKIIERLTTFITEQNI